MSEADAPSIPPSEKEAPKTFLERGASVPFTTPSLMWARVRQASEHIKELLVPGLANTRGIYVFEWGGISQRFTLTLDDRLLHRALALEKNPSPTAIARIANQVALGGSAGPEVQAAGRRRVKETENLVLMARLTLTMRAIERMSGGESTTVEELGTEAGQRRAKQLLAKIAGGMKLTAEQLYDRIEALSTLLGDIGMPGMPAKAPTRQLLQRMVSLSRVLNEWAEEGRGESTVEAKLIARVAEATCSLCDEPVIAIDNNTRSIDAVLKNWENGKRIMVTSVERFAWLLDGWDRLVNMWLDVADKNASEQSNTLALMSYLLPLVPINELRAEEVEKWANMSMTLHTQARSSDTPATGAIDLEMMLRLEGHRAREAL
jgi:hypothetical protein